MKNLHWTCYLKRATVLNLSNGRSNDFRQASHYREATGHQTEEALNHYVGVDQLRLLEEFMRKSARRRVA